MGVDDTMEGWSACSANPASETFLVGDVGGTNCRWSLAVASEGRLRLDRPQSYKCADFPGLQDAIAHYLGAVGRSDAFSAAVIAVAGPINDGVVQSTNMRWRISEAELRDQGAPKARLINDYTGLGLAVDHLDEDDVVPIGPSVPRQVQDTVAVVGAGTGFGVGAVARGIGGSAVIATEGGHISFAPVDEIEVDILRILTQRFGRVSIERLLSGPGLANLRAALAQIEGVRLDPIASEDIVRAADDGDALSARALDRFCAIYGSVAGDIALVYGARGGVFLGGGIAPAIATRLQASAFRERFEAKGRFQAYLSAIPPSRAA